MGRFVVEYTGIDWHKSEKKRLRSRLRLDKTMRA